MPSVRTEKRAVRPFVGLGQFHNVLRDVALVIGDKAVAESVTLTPDALLTTEIALQLGLDGPTIQNALETSSLSADAVELLVFAKSKTLKRTVVVTRRSVAASPPADVRIDRAIDPLLFDDVSSGFTVVVALLLATNLPREPLRPYLKGTWLARREFVVHIEHDEALFVPVPLDDVLRKQLKLPAKTMSFVHFSDTSPLQASGLDELLEFLVDDSVLGHLKAAEKSPEARLVMTQLVAQLLTAVLLRGARDLSDEDVQLSLDEDGPSRSVFARILAKVSAGHRALTQDALVEWAKTDPDRISAAVAHAVALQSETLNMLAGTQ